MILKRLRAKNFYSFKSLDLDLSKFKNIVYVRGVNRDSGGSNGSGKSSVLEMITFALFGKTIRKSTEDALINCDNKKNLEVEITLEKKGIGQAVITRGKRPNVLNFYLGGVDMTQENAIKTQEKIEKELSLSYKTFVASIVFGQHVDLEFLSASADDKRTIVRNFLNLDDIFSWRDKIKELKSEYSNGIKTGTTLLQELTFQRDKLKSKLVDAEPVQLKETMEQVMARESLITNRKELLTALKYELDDLQNKRYPLERQHKLGVYAHKDTCKTCKKVYMKKQTEGNLRGLFRRIAAIQNKELKLTKKIDKLNKEVAQLASKTSLKEWVLLKQKQDLFLSQEKIKQEYNELLSRTKVLEAEKQKLEVNYEVMRFWEKAFSEQGIIKYFVRNILDYLNFKTNEYLSLLTNSQFTISFSEELEETIHNNGRKLSYISLSGGEKRKINLSVMLALQSLLTHTSKEQSNIIFFDEIAENMDEDGCQGVHNLLKSLKEEDKTIFLITHNAHLKSLLDGCQILTIEKRNGESRII